MPLLGMNFNVFCFALGAMFNQSPTCTCIMSRVSYIHSSIAHCSLDCQHSICHLCNDLYYTPNSLTQCHICDTFTAGMASKFYILSEVAEHLHTGAD